MSTTKRNINMNFSNLKRLLDKDPSMISIKFWNKNQLVFSKSKIRIRIRPLYLSLPIPYDSWCVACVA